MRRPSSTSASRAPRHLLAFFSLALISALAMDRFAFSRRAWLNTVELGRWAEPQWVERADLLRRMEPKPRVLIVGDSSLGYGVQPSLLSPGSFTLSRPGLNCRELGQMSDRLSSLCQPPPKMIVVGLVWFEFLPFEPEFGFIQGDRPKVQAIAAGFYSDPNLVQTDLFPGSRVARYWVDHRIETTGGKRKTVGIIIGPDGFGTSQSPSEGAHPKMPPQLAETVPGWFTPESLRPLEHFLRHWESAGVLVVFVSMPLHPAFRTKLLEKAGADQTRLREGLHRLFGARFLDYEGAVADTGLFRDATHLNAEGARRFTSMLREDMRRQGLLPAEDPNSWISSHPPASAARTPASAMISARR